MPSLLFFNAGWLHHVGPNRLYVFLARSFGKKGAASLRFDFSGIGDSPSRADGLPLRRAALVEAREALNCLEQQKEAGPLVVGGLCSGADVAYRVALADERVKGVFFFDGFPYRTPGWYLRHYVPRLLRGATWKRLFSGSGALKDTVTEALGRPDGEGRDIPRRREARDGLEELLSRGVSLLFVYTGGMRGYYNDERQFGEIFPHLGDHARLRTHYLPAVDHIFSFEEHQHRLARIMSDWLAGLEGTGQGVSEP